LIVSSRSLLELWVSNGDVEVVAVHNNLQTKTAAGEKSVRTEVPEKGLNAQ
jgi:hypothetical protein